MSRPRCICCGNERWLTDESKEGKQANERNCWTVQAVDLVAGGGGYRQIGRGEARINGVRSLALDKFGCRPSGCKMSNAKKHDREDAFLPPRYWYSVQYQLTTVRGGKQRCS